MVKARPGPPTPPILYHLPWGGPGWLEAGGSGRQHSVGRLAGLAGRHGLSFPPWQSGRGPGVLEPGERLRIHGEPGPGPDLCQEAPGDLPGGEPAPPCPQPPRLPSASLGVLPHPLLALPTDIWDACLCVPWTFSWLSPSPAKGPRQPVTSGPGGPSFPVARWSGGGSGDPFSPLRVLVLPLEGRSRGLLSPTELRQAGPWHACAPRPRGNNLPGPVPGMKAQPPRGGSLPWDRSTRHLPGEVGLSTQALPPWPGSPREAASGAEPGPLP